MQHERDTHHEKSGKLVVATANTSGTKRIPVRVFKDQLGRDLIQTTRVPSRMKKDDKNYIHYLQQTDIFANAKHTDIPKHIHELSANAATLCNGMIKNMLNNDNDRNQEIVHIMSILRGLVGRVDISRKDSKFFGGSNHGKRMQPDECQHAAYDILRSIMQAYIAEQSAKAGQKLSLTSEQLHCTNPVTRVMHHTVSVAEGDLQNEVVTSMDSNLALILISIIDSRTSGTTRQYVTSKMRAEFTNEQIAAINEVARTLFPDLNLTTANAMYLFFALSVLYTISNASIDKLSSSPRTIAMTKHVAEQQTKQLATQLQSLSIEKNLDNIRYLQAAVAEASRQPSKKTLVMGRDGTAHYIPAGDQLSHIVDAVNKQVGHNINWHEIIGTTVVEPAQAVHPPKVLPVPVQVPASTPPLTKTPPLLPPTPANTSHTNTNSILPF